MLGVLSRLLRPRKLKRGLNVVIVHGDVDGVSCAAIILRMLKQAEIIFTGPSRIHKVLGGLRAEGCNIVIADISPNPGNIESVLASLRRLRGRGNRLLWIDHHVWHAEALDRVKELADAFIKPSPSAARLVYELMARGDEVSRRIAEIADDADTGTYSMELSRAYKVATRRRSSRKKLLEKLKEGIFEDEEVQDWKSRAEEERQRSAELAKRVKIYSTRSGLRFGLIIARRGGSGSEAARIAMQEHGLDFVAVVRRNGRVSLYGRNPAINLLGIAIKYQGGGHPQACGFKLGLIERFLAMVIPRWEYRFLRDLLDL